MYRKVSKSVLELEGALGVKKVGYRPLPHEVFATAAVWLSSDMILTGILRKTDGKTALGAGVSPMLETASPVAPSPALAGPSSPVSPVSPVAPLTLRNVGASYQACQAYCGRECVPMSEFSDDQEIPKCGACVLADALYCHTCEMRLTEEDFEDSPQHIPQCSVCADLAPLCDDFVSVQSPPSRPPRW